MLTDSAVFSANDIGRNWNGGIWNTQGAPDDRWNLYYSSSLVPGNPTFINPRNDAGTSINLAMTPGTHTFLAYGEVYEPTLDPFQHFVLSLYFDGNQGAADISGLFGPTCATVCAVSDWNGLDLFGLSGLSTPNAQEAGTLSFVSGGYQVTLSKFTWVYQPNIDKVYGNWDNTSPYSNGSGKADFVGEIQIVVRQVPSPGSLALLALGLIALYRVRSRNPRLVAIEM